LFQQKNKNKQEEDMKVKNLTLSTCISANDFNISKDDANYYMAKCEKDEVVATFDAISDEGTIRHYRVIVDGEVDNAWLELEVLDTEEGKYVTLYTLGYDIAFGSIQEAIHYVKSIVG
jgi:hypothetical protein